MKSAAYWQKRMEQIAKRQFDMADGYDLAQQREYDRAITAIKRDIEVFYQRYAINNQVTMAEARKQLTTGELKEFKMSLEEFTAKAKDNTDGRWTQELNSVYYRTRVTRFEALLAQINQEVEMLAGSRQAGTEVLLGDIYKDTYHRTLYELQAGTGVGVSFARIDNDGLQTILGAKLDGRNWSQRIWGDRTKLRQELQTKISQSFIRGDSIDRTVKDVTERLNVSRSNAERLVQTESAFFVGQATMMGYKESGIVQKYEVLATLDKRTSNVCRGMDGKVFSLSEMEVGVNYPPFHVRCRTTTVSYFGDEISPGERIARGDDGETYYVPSDTTYAEWKSKYVDS
ncbi:minor capsid protein [Paenibacillus chitinolyticus]